MTISIKLLNFEKYFKDLITFLSLINNLKFFDLVDITLTRIAFLGLIFPFLITKFFDLFNLFS